MTSDNYLVWNVRGLNDRDRRNVVRDLVSQELHLQEVVTVQEEMVMAWWLRTRKGVIKQVRKGFDSLFFLIRWSIWKERNARTFNGTTADPSRLARLIQVEASEWCLAGYRHLLSLQALL